MQKSLIFFVVAAALVCLAFQVEAQVPLPPSHYGFRFGSDIAPVSIVMFGDLLCPQTKDQWNVLRNVLIHYGETHVKLDFTMFPLADERYSFDADRGAYVVQKLNPNNTIDAVRTWIDVVFANQDKFWDTPTYNMTASEVINAYGALAASMGLAKQDQFVASYSDEETLSPMKYVWKYGSSRGVSGTPTFLVNDVLVNVDPAWNTTEWQNLLDPLVQATFSCPPGTKICQYAPGQSDCCPPGDMCIAKVGCRCKLTDTCGSMM